MNRLFIALVFLLVLNACNTSKHVHSNRLIQKRKYTKGWHFNFKNGHKSDGAYTEEMNIEVKHPKSAVLQEPKKKDHKTNIKPGVKLAPVMNLEVEPKISVHLPLKDESLLSRSLQSKVEKTRTLTSLKTKSVIYPRFGVNDADTTLWIGVICLVLGLIAFAVIGSTSHFALSFILMLAGTVLLLIGFVNLIVGFFRWIM